MYKNPKAPVSFRQIQRALAMGWEPKSGHPFNEFRSMYKTMAEYEQGEKTLWNAKVKTKSNPEVLDKLATLKHSLTELLNSL